MRQFLSLSFTGLVFLSAFAHADDLGERRQYDSLTFYAQTTDSSGGEANASSAPIYRVYQEGAFLFQNTMTQLDSSNTSGFYSATIQLTPANAFDRGKHYAIRIRATVSSVNKPTLHTFRIHPNEILIQHDGNNSTSGATAESRIEASTAGTVVFLSPGIFDMGTAELAIPDGVSVRGAGMSATRIKSSISSRFVIPGDRSRIERLTIEASASGGRSIGCGSGQQFDDAVLRDARLIAHSDCIHIQGTTPSSITVERVWLETEFDGIVIGQAAHNAWLRDIFVKAKFNSIASGLTASNATEVRGTRVNIDISSAPGPIGVSVNDTALVELFDSSIWVDPAASAPASVNVNSSTAIVRLINCEFDRSLISGQTQQIRDVFSPLRPTLLTGAKISSLTSQTQFTLSTGPPDTKALNGRWIIITDNADGRRKAVGVVSSYVGSTRQVTLSADPGIFTMGVSDEVDVIPQAP